MLHLPRCSWSAFWLFLLACPSLYAQKVEARFNLHKTDYVVDEPIFVTIEVDNLGSKQVGIFHESPYCGLSYRFQVDPPGIDWVSCHSTAGSCVGSPRAVPPGGRFQEEILLQYWMRLRQPGVYRISSQARIYYINSYPDLTVPSEPPVEVRANLTVSIHAPQSPQELQAIYQPILEDLSSKEEEKWIEAARIITEVAPAFLEPTILAIAKDPARQYYALNGLRKLNTPKSRAVLADWAGGFRNTYSSTQEIAIRYLGEMGDRNHMPLLLRLAKQSGDDYLSGQSLNAYAELGGDEAVPELLLFLKEHSPSARGKALWALARTGSRNAVAPLIENIRAKGHTEVALSALQALTHKRLPAPLDPATAHRKWDAWWKANGSSARIFGPTECGESETFD